MNAGTLITVLLAIAGPSASAASAASLDVLLVGNSYSYTNNLPALVNALAASHAMSPPVHAELIAAPGGSLADRWQDGVVARELASGRWEVLVLQERGGLLACLGKPGAAEAPDCRRSVSAHQNFVRLARQHKVRVILLGTWGPDSIWQGQLSRGLRKLAGIVDAETLDAGPLLRAHGKDNPDTPMFTDAILHPSLDASLLTAMALYQQLTRSKPPGEGLRIDAPMPSAQARLSPASLMSTQVENLPTSSEVVIDQTRLAPLARSLSAEKAPAPR